MYTVVIRESNASSVVVTWHQDEMPAFESKEYDSLSSALAANPGYNWREPDEDDEGDVLKVATYR